MHKRDSSFYKMSSNVKLAKSRVLLSPENVRRIGPEFTNQVKDLVAKDTFYLFGKDNVESLLTDSFISLALFNEVDELVATVCFNNHPNVPAIPPWEWAHWLNNLYPIKDVHQLTCAWIHLIVYDRRYTQFFMRPILTYFYEHFEHFQKLLMVVPAGVQKLDFMVDDFAVKYLPKKNFVNAKRVQGIYELPREFFVCKYKIRRAVEEDNDDLVALIPKELKDLYGEFYISEILTLQKHVGRQIIVAEYRDQAVGVLILNPWVNLEMLGQYFELVVYNGLRKNCDEDDLTVFAQQNINLLASQPVEDSLEVEHISEKDLLHHHYDVQNKSDTELEENSLEASSDSEYSLVNISSTYLFNYDNEVELLGEEEESERRGSIESQYSAVILNSEYENHTFDTADRSETGSISPNKRIRSNNMAEVEEVFFGDINVFVMEVCISIPDHEICLFALYEAAFECFPDRDYCITSFPASQSHRYVSRHFTWVAPKPHAIFPHEIYVLHKNAIRGHLMVRIALPDDFENVTQLVFNITKSHLILEQLRDFLENDQSPYVAYVMLNEDEIVGLAIISEEFEADYLELHYHLEVWSNPKMNNQPGSHGCLDQYVLSPIFHKHNRFFMRELHRLSPFAVLYYRLRPTDVLAAKPHPISNVLSNLVPVTPKKLQEYDPNVVEEYEMPSVVSRRLQHSFALYLSTPRLTSIPRIEINTRIVAVGSGDTALAFLEALLFTRSQKLLVTFTNVTVLSPHGISYSKQQNRVRDMMFVNNGHIDRRHLDSICLRTYVHVVTGVMTAIDRKEKLVCVSDDTFLPYDLLLLFCGEQFQKPKTSREIATKRPEYPFNVFIINTEADAGNALTTMKNLAQQYKKHKSVMVVYGHFLEACCCVSALLEFGISGDALIYVDPPPDPEHLHGRHEHIISFFNDKDVENSVMDEMRAQGVTIYQDFTFIDWKFDSELNVITAATFESKYKIMEIDLCVLFMYHSKAVSAKTFQAITKAGLVFDGRLVVDLECRTNDRHIYGAGTITKFSRRFYADHLMHKFFNGEEIGRDLGLQIRQKLISDDQVEPPPRKALLRMPIISYCRMAGCVNYLSVTKPGMPVPRDVAMNKEDYGKVLMTGHPKKLERQGYFRLHLNKYSAVESIKCLAKFEINVKNIISLYGKHEKMLNNLLLRFEMLMIPDLYDFFKEPWACAIYHNKFPSVMEECDNLYYTLRSEDGMLLINEVRKLLEENDYRDFTKLELDELEELFKNAGYFKIMEEKLLSFLQENQTYLPMYAHPVFVRMILHEVKNSPMFVKK